MEKQKGLAPLLIVVIIALAVSGYLIYQKKATSNPIPTPLPQQTPQPSPSPADETANWKTYTNAKLGYSFKYPQDWIDRSTDIDKQQNIVRLVYIVADKEHTFFVGAKERGGPPADEIEGTTVKYGNTSFSRRIWMKDNKPFFIVARPDNYSVAGGIEINLPPDSPDTYIKVFDQILSTFKFTQ